MAEDGRGNNFSEHSSALEPAPARELHNPADEEKAMSKETEWKPSAHELAIMLSLSVTSLMTALDATIVTTTVGVSPLIYVSIGIIS